MNMQKVQYIFFCITITTTNIYSNIYIIKCYPEYKYEYKYEYSKSSVYILLYNNHYY